MNKFITWQQYLEKFDSFQEAYENYYEIYEKLEEKDKEIGSLKNIINEAIKRSDELANEIEDLEGSYSYMLIEIINILKGGNK